MWIWLSVVVLLALMAIKYIEDGCKEEVEGLCRLIEALNVSVELYEEERSLLMEEATYYKKGMNDALEHNIKLLKLLNKKR